MSSKDIERIQLQNLCKVSSSKRIYANEYVSDGIPFLRSKEVIELAQKKEISLELFISKERFLEIKEKYEVPKYGDILISAIGANLGIPYFVELDHDFYFKDGNVVWLSQFKNVINSQFLNYWLSSKEGQNSLLNATIGSAQKAMTIDLVKKIEVPFISLDEQNKIVKILYSIDDKIDINNKINKNIEEIARTIFKNWFVDFGPFKDGEFVDSELGMIPKGWSVSSLDELIIRNKHKIRNYEDWKDELLIDLSNMPQYSIAIADFDKGEKFTTNIYKLCEYDILFGSIRSYFGKAGFSAINGVVTGTVFSYIPKIKENYSFVLFLTTSKKFVDFTVSVSKGTKMPIVGWDDFKSFKCAVPKDKQILEDFNSLLLPLIDYMKSCILENVKLKSLRDSLLPKLMMGEIRVPLKKV